MKNEPLVSVCILSYNRAEGLSNTLSLIRNQTYRNLEIIISDDCSAHPEVKKIATEACIEDSRISYYRQEKNLGIIGNHDFLLNQVKGKYLMWACDDDWWHHEFISSCVSELEKSEEAVLCTTNSTMQWKNQFVPLHECVDTRNISSPSLRFKKVLRNVLWSNHTFYGVMRTSVAQVIELKKRLGFDIFFVCELALKGEFIQIPHFYFRKTIGGNGYTIQGNLDAVKVQNRFSRMSPGFTFSLQMMKDCFSSALFSFQDILEVYRISREKPPFPQEKISLVKWLKNIPIRIHNRFNYLDSKRKTRSHELTMKLFELGISPDEVKFNPQNNSLELLLLQVTLDFPEQLDLLKGYKEYLEVMYQYDLVFEQEDSGDIKVGFEDVYFYLSSSNSFHIFKEVFIKRCYHVDVTQPSVVFDLGMNVGFTSMYFSRMKLVEKVYAFELFPYTAQLAEKNLALNPQLSEKVRHFSFGLSDTNTTEDLSFSPAYNGMNGRGEIDLSFYGLDGNTLEKCTVEFRSASEALQPLVAQYPTHQKILKIDVEGSEYGILEDLEKANLLGQFDIIMLEWHEKGPEKIERQLREADYYIVSQKDYHPSLSFNTGMIYAFKR